MIEKSKTKYIHTQIAIIKAARCVTEVTGSPFLSFVSLFIHFWRNASTMYSKDTAPSNESSRAEEMKLQRKRRRRRALHLEDRFKFKGQPAAVQSDSCTRCLSHSQVSVINHSLVIICQTPMRKEVSLTLQVDPRGVWIILPPWLKDGKDFSCVCLMMLQSSLRFF